MLPNGAQPPLQRVKAFEPPSPDLAEALWKHREELRDRRASFELLRERVDSPGDLTLGQYAQLYALTLEYEPELVVELGRGYGNSTCVFAEAATRVPDMSVVSIGYDGLRAWEKRTAARLAEIRDPSWFAPLTILHQDVLDIDFADIAAESSRTLLFWDAHGGELAAHVLRRGLPALGGTGREVLVAVHDMTDARHEAAPREYIRDNGFPSFWQGELVSAFAEVMSLFDFFSRNRLPYATPAHSLALFREAEPQRWAKLEDALAEYPAPSPLAVGYWLYFKVEDAEESGIIFPPSPEQMRAALEVAGA